MTNKNISTKKLKAIVFTDIVGFTNISAQNEQLALDLIDKQRDLLKPIVLKNHGEWLKEIGDGLLLTFPTVSGAVKCSIKCTVKFAVICAMTCAVKCAVKCAMKCTVKCAVKYAMKCAVKCAV